MIVTEQIQIGKKIFLIASGILIRISKQFQYSVTSLKKKKKKSGWHAKWKMISRNYINFIVVQAKMYYCVN